MPGAKIIPLVPPDSLKNTAIRWIGGVVQPHGFRFDGKPMRVAAWITTGGSVLGAAIVDGHGPTVLREMLMELLASAPADKRPGQLVVWPSVRAAFRDMQYPKVVVDRARFLSVVVEDQVDCGSFPGRLPIRRARAAR